MICNDPKCLEMAYPKWKYCGKHLSKVVNEIFLNDSTKMIAKIDNER